MSIFKPIKCGQTLPPDNIHAISVSMPTLQDVIDYEEQTPQIKEIIKSGYPRFVLHPYLKLIVDFLKNKYKVPSCYEVVLLSSQEAVKIVSEKYFIHNPFEFDEPFGVILVLNETSQLQKVLTFIQYVGTTLSSRNAEDYLLKNNLISKKQDEILETCSNAKDKILDVLASGYNQPRENIALCTSGMNAIYAILKGIKSIQAQNGRDVFVQFGWLYLDSMNIIQHYFKNSKIFYDVEDTKLLEEFLKKEGLKVSAIITEIPTNPLLKVPNLEKLHKLSKKYNIPLVVDSTFSTPYGIDLKPYADICVESLSKFASGNADVLMGAIILNENSKFSYMTKEFFKHCDKPYIKDTQRLAYEIKEYKNRIKKISQNTKELVEFLQTKPYIKKIYFANFEENSFYCGVISLEFNIPFKKVYDTLNFAKGPSLGTEFTLLMPYVYLAHYDMISTRRGREFLEKNNFPIDLLRVSVGIENIKEIKAEFDGLIKLY